MGGLWSMVNGLQLDSVYDATVAPSADTGKGANIVTLAQGIPCEMHVHMDRLLPDSIPRQEEDFTKWLYGRWAAKDRRIDTFISKGSLSVDTDKDQSTVELMGSSAAALVVAGAVCWYFVCALSFAKWCISGGRVKLLGGVVFIFILMLVGSGAASHAVHFKKSSHGKKTK